MQHVSRVKWVLAAAALAAVLGAGALAAAEQAAPAAPATPAGNGGVVFQNDSHRAIEVFARYGSDNCESAPNQVEIQVPAGSSSTVDSGSSGVCFCLDVPDRNTCPSGWARVKPGGKRVFR